MKKLNLSGIGTALSACKHLVVLPGLLIGLAASAAYQVKDLTAVVAPVTLLFGINDRGDMVGQAGDDTVSYGFVLRGGTVEKIFDASLGNSFSAQAISNTGVVAVAVSSADRPDSLPWTYLYENGTFTLVAEGLYARGISPDGRYLTGLRGGGSTNLSTFVYDTVDRTYLPAGDGNRYLQDVNSHGIVAGSRLVEDPVTLELDMVGTTVDLRTGASKTYRVHQSATGSTYLRGINDQGDLAGRVWDEGGPVLGFHLSAAGVVERFQAGGSDETFVEGLNNAGVMVGHYTTADGGYRAFVATPVPEPSTVWMAAAGLLFVGCLVRQRSGRRWEMPASAPRGIGRSSRR